MAGPFHDARAAAVFRADKLGKVSLFESARMFCDVYALMPGQSQAGHVHADNDKLYVLLEGRCRVTVGAESRTLAAGELAVAAAGVEHGLHNDGPEPAKLLAIMAPHPSFKG
jgi:quercetin dioxygenase-like cupin family protein